MRMNVIRIGNFNLRAENEDIIFPVSSELEILIADLFETAIAEGGVGLAAPQVNIPLNIAVVDLSVGRDKKQKIVLINPKIISTKGEQIGYEGCLSIPGVVEICKRPQKVVLENTKLDGTKQTLVGKGLLARAFCHEIDHLNGELFVDKLSKEKQEEVKRKFGL